MGIKNLYLHFPPAWVMDSVKEEYIWDGTLFSSDGENPFEVEHGASVFFSSWPDNQSAGGLCLKGNTTFFSKA